MTEEKTPETARGMPGNPVRMTDPAMMRALAHPARLAILTHLFLRGPATATECADVAGLSPSACSYHLRQLAHYGIVEEARDDAADGRQRPWRIRTVAFHIPDDNEDPATELAAGILVDQLHADAEQTRARYLTRKARFPAAWQHSAGEYHDVAYLTASELDELKNRINDIVGEYRRLDPAERRPGDLPVRIWLNTYPWFGPEEA